MVGHERTGEDGGARRGEAEAARAPLGDLVREWREAVGLTQRDLAEEAGVSVRGLRDIEGGRSRSPQRRTLRQLADALGLDDREYRALTGRRSAPDAPGPGGPCTLPGRFAGFTGRTAELRTVRDLAERASGGALAETAACVVSGQPGTGKSTLSVRAAEDAAPLFPDGQLALDLRGTRDAPPSPEHLLGSLLRTLGLPAGHIPADGAEREALYRSVTRERSVLVLLDDAADEAQVRPLLPVGPRSLALVTSRRPLSGLHGVVRLRPGPMTPEESLDLLRQGVGSARLRAEPGAARDLAELCGHLPLALRIVSNRLAARPPWGLAPLADELRDEGRRLTRLRSGDLAVTAAFARSRRKLSPGTRTVFDRLGLVQTANFGARVIAAASGCDRRGAVAALEELADLGLVEPAATSGRYRLHDLLRLYARERLAEPGTAALRMALHGYVRRLVAADRSRDADAEEIALALRWLRREQARPGAAADPHAVAPPVPPEGPGALPEARAAPGPGPPRTRAAAGQTRPGACGVHRTKPHR
ncbi:helix-turn-helix domain-containing protein [Streptomyces sp. NPDC021098]|uniref:helix-turn-helix domain-containing protein n=1 Tax=unclassified Streptomyces TaxID=2593676 RepID=UPI00378EAC87